MDILGGGFRLGPPVPSSSSVASVGSVASAGSDASAPFGKGGSGAAARLAAQKDVNGSHLKPAPHHRQAHSANPAAQGAGARRREKRDGFAHGKGGRLAGLLQTPSRSSPTLPTV